jgi:hypothetical protein
MKKIIVIGLLTFIMSGLIRSQMTFTVKPGLNLNSANIGVKSEKFSPYFGLQFLNVTSKSKYVDEYEPGEDRKIKTHIYMPYLGFKAYLFNKDPLKGSITTTVFKPVIFGKETIDGEEDESYKENLKNLKIWGGEIGFCSEYFLNEHFSIGGEFGFRFAFYKDKDESEYSSYSYDEDLKLNMTYVSGSMNFYF